MRRRSTLALALTLGALAGCSVDVEGAACRVPGATEDCPAGQACGAGLTCSVAAAACSPCAPGTVACRDGDVKTCSDATDPVCGSWVLVEGCGSLGLACAVGAGPACACPPHLESPVVLHADPAAETRPGLVRNGASTPACRYLTLADALAAATSGDTVRAAGFAGVPVVFTEGPLLVPDGVAVGTDDAAPDPTHYVVEPAAAVGASAFVTLRPGASLSGLTIRNVGASGAGVETSCAGAADTAAVTLDTVHVIGLGSGATPPRFSNGVRHGGNCSLALTGSTVEGADDTGVIIADAAASTSLTMTGNLIRSNQANVTSYTIGATDRAGGGLVFFGVAPGAVTFTGNRLLANAGDQVLVFSPGVDLDLSTPACGAASNTFACYAAPGVGVSSRFGTVTVAHAYWAGDLPSSGADFVAAAGAVIAGATTQACGAAAEACP